MSEWSSSLRPFSFEGIKSGDRVMVKHSWITTTTAAAPPDGGVPEVNIASSSRADIFSMRADISINREERGTVVGYDSKNPLGITVKLDRDPDRTKQVSLLDVRPLDPIERIGEIKP